MVPLSFLPPFLLSNFCLQSPEIDPALFLGSRFVRAKLRAGWTKKREDARTHLGLEEVLNLDCWKVKRQALERTVSLSQGTSPWGRVRWVRSTGELSKSRR